MHQVQQNRRAPESCHVSEVMADALLVLSQTALRRAAGSQLSVLTVHAACFDPGSYHLPASGDQLVTDKCCNFVGKRKRDGTYSMPQRRQGKTLQPCIFFRLSQSKIQLAKVNP